MYGELFGSFLLLLPVWNWPPCASRSFSFSALHLLIASTMSVGMFPLVGIVAASAFLPSVLLGSRRRARARKTRVSLVARRGARSRRGCARRSEPALDPLPERPPSAAAPLRNAGLFGGGVHDARRPLQHCVVPAPPISHPAEVAVDHADAAARAALGHVRFAAHRGRVVRHSRPASPRAPRSISRRMGCPSPGRSRRTSPKPTPMRDGKSTS